MNMRLQEALIEENIDSNTLVDYANDEYDNVYVVSRNKLYSAYYIITNKLEKYILKSKYPHRQILPFSFGTIGKSLWFDRNIKDCDIIHLHWICNFLSIRGIGKLIKLKKPIIWTIHDSWAFTGGCHVRYGCSQYSERCLECKELSDGITPLTSKILQKKYKYWKDNSIIVVAPSTWMRDCLLQSNLFKKENVKYIPNPIDTKVFAYKEKNIDREFTILFGAVQGTKVAYKGYSYLLEALDYLAKENPSLKDKIVLNIFGSDSIEEDNIIMQFKHNNLGVLKSDEALVKAYQDADVYVLPTLDDNLPTTVLESMSCGTPVVSFEVGGVPDMIDHKINGYLAKYKNSRDLAEGIAWVYRNNKDNILSINARDKIQKLYDKTIVARKYIELYQECLRKR